MTLDPLPLSRLQFGWHILLPAFTIGLAAYIAYLEGTYFVTGREIYFRISTIWTKVFPPNPSHKGRGNICNNLHCTMVMALRFFAQASGVDAGSVGRSLP